MKETVIRIGLVAILMLFFGCNGGTLGVGGNGDGVDGTEGPGGSGGSSSDGTGSSGIPGVHVDENGGVCTDPSPCGDCDHDCRLDGYNPSSGGDDGSGGSSDGEGTGVVETEEGIEVDVQKIEAHFIWIANTSEGTVSKIDTRTYEEVGRYDSGPDGRSNDPSRTSVNSYADVFVGNRRGLSVTKISSLGENCPDTNGDGQITTSTGPNDVLPWGQDDCVLWNTRLTDGDIIRAVAAQDVVNGTEASQPSVWIGGWDGVAWKLDSDTGNVILRTTTPVRPYGFALDGSGNLWISSRERAFGRIDTNRCTDEASCNVQVGGDADDGSIKQRIEVDNVPYGITVDHKQRVWLGGDSLVRYDATNALGSRLTYVRGPGSSIWLHGVQADLDGNIWAAAYGRGAMRFDAETPSNNEVVAQTQGQSSKGIAIDLDGKVWSINMQSNDADVITPGQEIDDNPVVHTQTGLVQPYTYSDMTGSQLRFATDQTGFFRRTFGGCDDTTGTDWIDLRWDAETPQDTRIKFVARAAETVDGLQGTDWLTVATTPPDQSPIAIGQILTDNGMGGLRYLQVEAQLTAVRQPDGSHVTPTLKSLEVTYHCGPSIDGSGDGSGGNNNGDGSNNGNGSGGNNNDDGGPNGMCAPAGSGCVDNDDCCSGAVCGAGTCITQ